MDTRYTRIFFRASLSAILLLRLVASQSAPCYFPDGSLATAYASCGLDNSTHSSCCAVVDGVTCLSGNLCYNRFGYVYRGACTDQTWEDPACPKEHCQQFSSGGMNILACDDAKGQWCCATGGTVPCCEDKSSSQFYLNPGSVTYIAKALKTASPSTTTSTTSAAATTTSSTPASTSSAATNTAAASTSDDSKNGLSGGAIGGVVIGVLIPLGIAIAFGLLWFRERKQRQKLEHYLDGNSSGPLMSETQNNSGPPAPPPPPQASGLVTPAGPPSYGNSPYSDVSSPGHGFFDRYANAGQNQTTVHQLHGASAPQGNATELPITEAPVKPLGWQGGH